jgi:putative tryptophan/tyrosine transport system substrate-binding protein
MQLSALRTSAAARNLTLRLHELQQTDPEAALQDASRLRVDALLILPSIETFLHRTRIAEFAAAQRLAAVYGLVEFVESGGLMSYAFNYADNFRRAADYVDKILKGAKPADLPVQLPDKFELVINLRAANALGLNIPMPVLVRADRVIQ